MKGALKSPGVASAGGGMTVEGLAEERAGVSERALVGRDHLMMTRAEGAAHARQEAGG